MKRLLLFSLILCNISQSEGQLPWYQYSDRSCWAASLAFVTNKVGETDKNQSYFINKRYPAITEFSDCTVSDLDISAISSSDMFCLTKSNIKSYECSTDLTMGLEFIKMQVIARRKPIIYNYKYDSDNSHIVVIDSIEYTHLPTKNSRDKGQTAFFRIKDPWPKCEGNEYFSTYERYHIQDKTCYNDKYTIYANNPSSNKCEEFGIKTEDKAYLKNILKSAEPETLVNTFLRNTKNRIESESSRLSGDFFRITNLPNSSTGLSSVNIGSIFKIINVGASFFVSMHAETTITTLLNHNYDDKIVCLNVEKTTITSVSVSEIQSCNSNRRYFPVSLGVNQWILYQIENGQKYNEFFMELADIKDSNHKINNEKEGVIIRFADANFVLFTVENKYYVYDLYGNGFNILGKKAQKSKIIDFDEFLALAKIYKPQ